MGFKDSQLFRRAVSKAYRECDVDGTGRVDYKEVMIGLLKVYDNLNQKLPDHIPAPKRRDMIEMCQKFDVDGDGCLDPDEFLELAKVLFGTRRAWRDSLPWIIGSSLALKLLILPLAAAAIAGHVRERHGGPSLPEAPLAAALGIVFKWAAKRI